MAEQNLPQAGGAVDPLATVLQGGISNADIQQALSPTLQRVPMQMPSYFTTPRREMQGPAMMNKEPVIGAGNAKGRDIGNAVSASVRTLSNFVAKRDQMNQQKEARKVQTLLSAQAGMDQAQQQLSQMKPTDPGYGAAKASLDQNQRVINTLFQDKKFVNSVQKGFDISLTDPSQNKTEHHSIVQRGIDLFKKQHQVPFTPEQAKAMAAKFNSMQPSMLAPNPMALQNLQLRQQLQKDQMQLMRSIVPALIREQASAKRTEYVQQRMDARARLTQENENGRKLAELVAKHDQKLQDYAHAKDLVMLHSTLALRNAETILGEKAVDPSKLLTARDTFNEKMTASEQTQQRLILSLTQDRDYYQQQHSNEKAERDPALMEKNHKINEAEQKLKQIQEGRVLGMQQFSDRITGKIDLGGDDGKSDSGSNRGTAASGGTASRLNSAQSVEDVYKALNIGEDDDDE